MLHVNIYNYLNGYRAQSLTSIRDHTFHIQGHCRVVEQGQPVFGALFSLQQVQFACFHICSCRSESQSATLCDHQPSLPNCLHLCHSSSYLSCRHPYSAAWDVPEIWCPRQVGHIAGFWAHGSCPCGVCDPAIAGDAERAVQICWAPWCKPKFHCRVLCPAISNPVSGADIACGTCSNDVLAACMLSKIHFHRGEC